MLNAHLEQFGDLLGSWAHDARGWVVWPRANPSEYILGTIWKMAFLSSLRTTGLAESVSQLSVPSTQYLVMVSGTVRPNA